MGPPSASLLLLLLPARTRAFQLVWWAAHAGLFALGWFRQQATVELAPLNLLRDSVWVSRGAGLCLAVDGFLLFVPVCRNLMSLLRPKLRRLVRTDHNIWFHRQVAYTTLFFTAVHTTAHYVNMLAVERSQLRPNTAVGIMYTQPGGLTGHVMLLIMVLMYTTASQRIRKQCFEAFWYTHHLAFFWAVAFYSHASGCFVRGGLPGQPVQCMGYNSVYFTLWSGAAYFADRVWREIRGRKRCEIHSVLAHPSGTVEIRLKKQGFKFVPGQWIYLQVPQVSKFQWHPFTISSAPDDPYLSIHVRQVGDFTRALAQCLGATPQLTAALGNTSGNDEWASQNVAQFVDITSLKPELLPRVRIDGPYGAPAQDVSKCEVAILIGAGIGVTPFSSVLKNIYYMHQKGKLGSLKKVHFVWLNKNIAAFGWFRALLKHLEEIQSDASFLRMDMYLTGVVDKDTISNLVLNAGAQRYDTLTGLRSRTHFGRPKWSQEIFGPIRRALEAGDWYESQSKDPKKVGVFYCGPGALAQQLKIECQNSTTKLVKFHLYKEHF